MEVYVSLDSNSVCLVRRVMHGQCESLSQLMLHAVESGESLEFEDTVIVMGDCRRGSSVKSAGNVIVLGRCAIQHNTNQSACDTEGIATVFKCHTLPKSQVEEANCFELTNVMSAIQLKRKRHTSETSNHDRQREHGSFRLLGRVVAGAEDDRHAVVVAGEMQPHSIQIADVKLKPSYWHRAGYAFGQVAYVRDSQAAQGDQVEAGDRNASIVQVCFH